MSKFLFEKEYELNCSPKIVFPYLSTLSGLEQWFVDSATIDAEKNLDLLWDDEHHFCIKQSEKKDKSVKYEFLDKQKKQINDPNTLEFSLTVNDFTNMLYIKVSDYSSESDTDELNDLWDQLILGLKDIVGG